MANTTVLGEVDGIPFKATGKEILDPGWRVLFPKPAKKTRATTDSSNSKSKKEEEKILPSFTAGESGPHQPALVEKQTQPPKYYTEATLLRAMETAGKNVDDDELRELMKANGIGRPSTRANIIETLFRRRYIRRQKKLIMATDTGIQLIDTIQNSLLKSAELTGQWEKQLRDIEEGNYSASEFISNMKKMVDELVVEVRMAKGRPRITSATPGEKIKSKKTRTKKAPNNEQALLEVICPKCRKGKLLKGKTAYGCGEYKSGCTFRLPFTFKEKKLPATQLNRLMAKGSTVQLKGFKIDGKKVAGKLHFDEQFNLKYQPIVSKKNTKVADKKTTKADPLPCPKCKKGQVVKGKTAYGCSLWQTGCKFRISFDEIRQKAKGQPLTKELVWKIMKG